MYMLTALSTRSNSLRVLVLGRILGGTATSLLFSAPEAWMVGEHSRLSLSGAVFLFFCFMVGEHSRVLARAWADLA
jgi:hypothetical protein